MRYLLIVAVALCALYEVSRANEQEALKKAGEAAYIQTGMKGYVETSVKEVERRGIPVGHAVAGYQIYNTKSVILRRKNVTIGASENAVSAEVRIPF